LDSVAAVNWEAYESEGLAAVTAALSEAELDDVRVRYLGRKSELAQALRGVRDRESGMLLNGVRDRLEAAVGARDAELKQLAYEAAADSGIDVTIPGTPIRRGRLHLLTQIRREIEDIFLGMGYEVWDGNEVATVWENFDALTSDPGHPSRSQFDTFYIDANTVLRTHTSPDQIRAMKSRKPPLYMVSPGRPTQRIRRSSCRSNASPSIAASRSPTFRERC
jgi:phenylalanyl-tRNA synthetase alpha chain